MNKFLGLLLVYGVFFGCLAFQITNAYFTDSATSQNNTFSTGSVTPPITSPVSTIANHIVISEVRIDGTNDFIELYNPTDSPINLDPYRLVKRTDGGITDTSIISFGNTNLIPAHGYFLWATSNSDFNLAVGADDTTGATLSTDNSVALRLGVENSGTIIDAVSWGSPDGVPLVEGGATANPTGVRSLERKAYVTSDLDSMTTGSDIGKGNAEDTNVNAHDFILRLTSQPQNFASGFETP